MSWQCLQDYTQGRHPPALISFSSHTRDSTLKSALSEWASDLLLSEAYASDDIISLGASLNFALLWAHLTAKAVKVMPLIESPSFSRC